MENKELVIYAVTENGEGKVKEIERIPLGELYNGTYELPIRLFREDVVLHIEIQEKEKEVSEDENI